MEAKELRTGNFVKSGKGIYKIFALSQVQILAIQAIEAEDQEKVFSTDGTIIKPIPLTEEWLLKFGFTNESRDNKFDINEWRFHVEKPFHYGGFLLCDGYSVITDRIKYVHQLQNLYYSLTGTELLLAKNKTKLNNLEEPQS